MSKPKDHYCDRCGKLIGDIVVRIGDATLCKECVAYLEELAKLRSQALIAARKKAQKECKG